jgi:phosphoglycerol geranylgeranyltransferase
LAAWNTQAAIFFLILALSMKDPITASLFALRQHRAKGLAMLLDPDKVELADVPDIVALAETGEVDYFFVGGSLVTHDGIHRLVPALKAHTSLPVVIFPGSGYQIVPEADGILFLSLISGRNPELLIGQHVIAAPLLRQTQLEVMATGYMLIDSGKPTTVHYISNSLPIPYNKPDIAVCTALAGQYLGLRLIYMDGGSGADRPVSCEMVKAVSQQVEVPLIVGGGIREVGQALALWEAGADLLVIGNALERDPEGKLLRELAAARPPRPKKSYIYSKE